MKEIPKDVQELVEEAGRLLYESRYLEDKQEKLVLKKDFSEKDFAMVMAIKIKTSEINTRMKEIYSVISHI